MINNRTKPKRITKYTTILIPQKELDRFEETSAPPKTENETRRLLMIIFGYCCLNVNDRWSPVYTLELNGSDRWRMIKGGRTYCGEFEYGSSSVYVEMLNPKDYPVGIIIKHLYKPDSDQPPKSRKVKQAVLWHYRWDGSTDTGYRIRLPIERLPRGQHCVSMQWLRTNDGCAGMFTFYIR